MSGRVWVDGRIVPLERASVSVSDLGLLSGRGVFETVRLEGGIPFALGRHLTRLRRSARVAGIDCIWTDDFLRHTARQVMDSVPEPPITGRLRITLTAGPPGGPPSLLISATPSPLPGGPATVAVSPWPVNERGPLVGAKTTSRLDYGLAADDAHRRGADEAILLNTGGFLVEGATSNLFVVVAGRLSTPSPSTGCLPGVTRDLVCDLVEVAERHDLTFDDLRLAPEAFLTSTTRGVQPITAVEGVALRSAPGPLTRAATAALENLRATTPDP